MDSINKQIGYLISLVIKGYCERNIVSVKPTDDLRNDLGFDSLDIKILTVKMENLFNVFIYDNDLGKIRTVSDIENLVMEKICSELSLKE
jgi:acyl carrier protein